MDWLFFEAPELKAGVVFDCVTVECGLAEVEKAGLVVCDEGLRISHHGHFFQMIRIDMSVIF